MKVLLIGGTGFIGRYVVKRLADFGHDVSVVHRGISATPNCATQIQGDANRLRELGPALHSLKPDVVVNFILGSGRQAEEMMGALSGLKPRIIVLSSMDVYRACGVLHKSESGGLQELPLTEHSELRTQPAYTPARMEMLKKTFAWLDDEYEKISVERIVLADENFPAVVLRLPMIYGPGDRLRFHRFYPVIKRIQDGRRKIFFEQEAARWRASKGYVENVAEAIVVACACSARGRIYNVAEPDTLTELEWAQFIAEKMHWDGEFVVLPRDQTPEHLRNPGNLKQHWIASSERMRRELRYHEVISRSEAVERTIEWEINHPPAEIPRELFNYSAEDAV